jgi:hypothetical protein
MNGKLKARALEWLRNEARYGTEARYAAVILESMGTRDTARLDYIGRTLHIDATGDEPIYAMFIPGTEGVKDKSDLRTLIDRSMEEAEPSGDVGSG